jgi:hypothetical protein
MTLATLKGMNFNMGDVADALKLKAADTMFGGGQKASEKAAEPARSASDSGPRATARSKAARTTTPSSPPASGVVDPLQWWGALTQQFQQIAATALKDVATQTTADTGRNVATGVAKEAMKPAPDTVKAATGGVRKSSVKRPAKNAGGR